VPEGKVTETAGEADLGLVVEALVSEEAHPVLNQGSADPGHRVVAEVSGCVDAPYLASDPSREGLDGGVDGGIGGGRHVGCLPGSTKCRADQSSSAARARRVKEAVSRSRCRSGIALVRRRAALAARLEEVATG
jgi:hypothetical protein